MPVRCLTDRKIGSLEAGERQYQVPDGEVPALWLRVNRTSKSWILVGRFGSRFATRRKIGDWPEMGVKAARDEARRWRTLLSEGRDPHAERARERRQRREHTFASVADDFVVDCHRRGVSRVREIERQIKRELVPHWGRRAVADITKSDVLWVIDGILARGVPYQARHVLGYISRIFNFTLECDVYGLERSPCDRLRPAKIIGPKEPRTRILSNAELRSLWHVCLKLGYPVGPCVQMMMLSGQRRSEVGNAQWGEFSDGLWTVPKERMKARATHVVPLTDEMTKLLGELPRVGEKYVFSYDGRKPINSWDDARKRIAALGGGTGFTFQDIRRTVRTHLSALPVPDPVRELVIAHSKPGLHKVYDQHLYLDEKLEALCLWGERLLRIV
jgi:integrase